MDVSNWINVGLLAATLFGGIVAAMTARNAARQSSTAALDARESAEAGKRSAAALEEANELRRAASRKPRWRATRIPQQPESSANGGPRLITMMASDAWALLNDGPGRVTSVRLRMRGEAVGDDFEGWGSTDFPADDVEEGLGGRIWVSRPKQRMGQAVLEVTWCDDGGTEQRAAVALI